MKHIKLLLLLLLLPVLLTGCVNYSEETWLNSNGSGKVAMEISISNQFAAMMTHQSSADPFAQEEVAKPFKGSQGIKLGEIKTYHKDGNQITVLNFEFNSLEALRNIKDEDGAPGFLGEITFAKNQNGQLVFTRTIAKMESGQTDEGDFASDFSGQMSAAIFSGFRWKYTIHFPSKVISANTADDHIDTKTNTVVWEIPFSALSRNSQIMTATLETPTPWLNILITVAALLVIVILVLTISKFTKKSTTEA